MPNFSNKKKIVVAMSGGIDSSVVACMLKEQGHEVIGITLQLFDYGQAISKSKTCCAGQDIYDAKIVAEQISIPHYVLDYESKFNEEVIEDFVSTYLTGETPLPCVKCNQSVKFKDLLKFAKDLKADYLATGHYVRVVDGQNKKELLKGKDPKKDQSYFLFATTQEQIDYLLFPLGSQTKEETRALAKKYNLHISEKPDSQDICFVPNGNYSEIVIKKRPDANKSGSIMHVDGYEIGTHEGIIHYTIGQRRKIGVSSPHPLYVIKIDSDKNIVYVGSEENLYTNSFVIRDYNWLGDDEVKSNEIIKVKIRSSQTETKAILQKHRDQNKLIVKLLDPQKSVTPGQACVFYREDRVLGGGWIIKNEENL
jgi:tRNA-specific 2-thiouridylase